VGNEWVDDGGTSDRLMGERLLKRRMLDSSIQIMQTASFRCLVNTMIKIIHIINPFIIQSFHHPTALL